MAEPTDLGFIAEHNRPLREALSVRYDALGTELSRRGIDVCEITRTVGEFAVAIPSWGLGTGGTRFARFPGIGEPRNVFEKIEDCTVIQALSGSTPTVSLHLPWDKTDDLRGLVERARAGGLAFDAVNSNTFQDQLAQQLSYKFGSLTHTDAAVRAQAVAHNLECIEIGKALGSKALTLWIGDGTNFPGQQSLSRSFERYLDSAQSIYAALPEDWRLLIEHKLCEPAFYATVIADWGTSLMAAQALGSQAFCLVDLGHHAPTVNIELIVARLIRARRLGGFHFNDSKYGDDDLDAGSIAPFRLFLVMNELVEAELFTSETRRPANMLDQSHNLTDPVESLMTSAVELTRAYAQALIVDRPSLEGYRESNDVLMAAQTLKRAFTTDVEPILSQARLLKGAAIDPVAAFRASGYRQQCAARRPPAAGSRSGIV